MIKKKGQGGQWSSNGYKNLIDVPERYCIVMPRHTETPPLAGHRSENICLMMQAYAGQPDGPAILITHPESQ